MDDLPRQLMARYGLNAHQLGDLLGVRHATVRRWLVDPAKSSYCPPSASARAMMALILSERFPLISGNKKK
jgi:hypothetical protein